MKKRYYAYIGALCSLLAFAGCDKESDTPEIGEKVPITLSAPSLPLSIDIQTQSTASPQGIQTRAETINNRSIGVVAVKTVQDADLSTLDWSGYYLEHAQATGTNTDLNGEKAVTFSPAQWWPFNPNEYLAFVAYSPYLGSNGVARVSGNTLEVTASETEAFPDFLYTVPVGPYNKETAKGNREGNGGGAVSLGEFQHAMAKLVIEVQVVDKDGTPINTGDFPDPNPLKVTKLEVSTKFDKGQLSLPQSNTAPTWDLGTELTDAKPVYTPVNTEIELKEKQTYTCLLLPDTEDNSFVSITINDGVGEAKLDLEPISGFPPVSTSTDVDLVMGHTTYLTINVRYVSIPNPPNPVDPEIELYLEGQLEEWDYQGKSTVTIQ